MRPSRVRPWFWAGGAWTERLRELACLTSLGKVVPDVELVVVTPNGRAHFELVAVRVHGRITTSTPNRSPSTSSTSSNSATTHCRDQPRTARRQVLDDLRPSCSFQPSICSTIWGRRRRDLRSDPSHPGGRDRLQTQELPLPAWSLQAVAQSQAQGRARKLQVADLRQMHFGPARRPKYVPNTVNPSRLGVLAIPERQRVALVELPQRYGRQPPP